MIFLAFLGIESKFVTFPLFLHNSSISPYSRKTINFLPIFLQFPPILVTCMCFFANFTCFWLPPILTVKYFCTLQYAYWTPPDSSFCFSKGSHRRPNVDRRNVVIPVKDVIQYRLGEIHLQLRSIITAVEG